MKNIMKFIYGSAVVLTTVIGLFFFMESAVAAEQKDKNSSRSAEEYQLETITVTAQKQEENIQKVPVAITAFTETELEDAGAETINDVIDMIPGLTLEPAGAQELCSYRGVTNSAFTRKNPVIIFLDGIPFDDSSNYDLDLVNIERVEVLRGPQGSLYGKNALGAVINIISKKPNNTMASKVTGEWGEDETYGVKGFVNGPIIKDKLFLGLSAKYHETRGFLKNDNPEQDYFAEKETKVARALLRWLPSDQLEINFHTGINQQRNGSDETVTSDTVRYHENKNPDDKKNSEDFNSALNISYTTDFAKLTSITTYQYTETDYKALTTGSFDNFDVRSLTQELRIQSLQKENAIKWLAGVYFSENDRETQEHGISYYAYNMKYDWPYDQDENTMAVFGQMTIPLLPSVKFTAGLRYEKINKELDYKNIVTTIDTGDLLSKVQWQRQEDWDALLPKGVLSWDITQDAMMYFSVAEGYLAGGLNTSNDDKSTAKFDEQTSLNYELGTKTAWLDNRLFLNAALFYVDIKDMHVWNESNPGIWIASNAAEAHSQGIEIEVKARPLQGLDIMASAAWTKAEFDEYEDYDGNTTLQTPEYTFNLAAQYRHVSGIFVRGEIEGYGKTYYDESNSLERKPFELINIKIGYEALNWDIYFYARNLLDEEYFSSIHYGYYTVGAPRTLGVIASIRF